MSFGERGRDSGRSIAPEDFSSRVAAAANIDSDGTPPPQMPPPPSQETVTRRDNVYDVRIRGEKAKAALSGVPSVMAAAMLGVGEATRNQIIKQLEAGGQAIKDKDGNVVGVVHDGPFEGSKVYTGRRIAGYTGEFANLVAEQESDDEPAGRLAGRGTDPITDPDPDPDGSDVNTDLPDLPDAPSGPGTGDASKAAKKKSKMGRESTIATGPSGLLTPARTRRRSLMAGLIQ